MKKLDYLGFLGVILIILLISFGSNLSVSNLSLDDLTAQVSGVLTGSVVKTKIIDFPNSVPGDGVTPAKIKVLITHNFSNSKVLPANNYCLETKHVEGGVRAPVICSPSGPDGISECAYAVASSTVSKFKVCRAVPCDNQQVATDQTCKNPITKTVINFYGKPDRNKSWLETIKNGIYPSDPTIIVKAHISDSSNKPIANFPAQVKVITISDSDNEPEQIISCGLTDLRGESLCKFTASSTGAWRFSGSPTFWNSSLGSVTSGIVNIPNHVVWTVGGTDIFESLTKAPDASVVGDLKSVALSEIDVVGSVASCENWAGWHPRAYDWCFKSKPKQIKDDLSVALYVIIDEQFNSSCSDVDKNTYRCRNTDATLKYIAGIAKQQSASSGKFIFDGIILDEPAYRSHQPGGDGNSIYRMDHSSRLIHKIFEETQKLHPGFKIILAENSPAFIEETLKPGSDGVVRKYDLISGYWYFSPKPEYIKSLAPRYAKGSGMWVNGQDWNPNAADTLKKHGMNTVFFLFGTGSGLEVPFTTLRDQILPTLQ